MSLVIIDDSPVALALFMEMLTEAGYTDVVLCNSFHEAYAAMCVDDGLKADLVIMDVNMPGEDGISACRSLKQDERFRDVPVIIVTASDDLSRLGSAFEAGAVDFVHKPVQEIELLARVRSALRLQEETERRKCREVELLELMARLEEVNRELERLSSVDGLTGIYNRRALDTFLEREWLRAHRERRRISLVMIDIDFFKSYNDTYGHVAGDDCLRSVAGLLQNIFRRPGDMVGRYGGEEFAAVVTETGMNAALLLAEAVRAAVSNRGIEHIGSPLGGILTVSVGVATALPRDDEEAESVVAAADAALYRAKQSGRDRVEAASSFQNASA